MIWKEKAEADSIFATFVNLLRCLVLNFHNLTLIYVVILKEFLLEKSNFNDLSWFAGAWI
jgi:hypothetical protein